MCEFLLLLGNEGLSGYSTSHAPGRTSNGRVKFDMTGFPICASPPPLPTPCSSEHLRPTRFELFMQKSNTFLIDKRHPLRVQVVASPKEISQPPLRYELIYFQDPDHYLTPQAHSPTSLNSPISKPRLASQAHDLQAHRPSHLGPCACF